MLFPMNSAKNPFDSSNAESEAEAEVEARAEADVRAGRLISHSAVRRWLQSWGTSNPLPRPRVGD
jgi:predicted transcriptional regulator